MSALVSEFRYAFRSLHRRPGAALVVILTLALGLGVNATFFSSFHAMVTRPLPFEDPERLALVTQSKPETGQTYFQVSQGNFFELRDQLTSFQRIEAYTGAEYQIESLSGVSGKGAERVGGAYVSAGLFPMLGVKPAQGRTIEPADDMPGAAPVAVLSERLWRQSLGGDPDVVGRRLVIDGQPHEIIGVMEPGFRFPLNHDLWTPLQLDRVNASRARGRLNLEALGRLAPGATVEQTLSEVRQLGSRLEQRYPETNRGWSFHVRELHEAWLPPVTQTASWVMQVLVFLVLLIVCVNVANMVLAQATARSRETALRTALGAGKFRLLRQAVAETLLLALAGGGLGLLLTVWQGDWLQRISPIEIPYWLDFRIDSTVVAYTGLSTVFVALFLGLLPWLQRQEAGVADELRGGGRGDSGTSGGRLRRTLVVVEYAMAVVVLVGAFLMVRAYQEVRQRDPGFEVDGLMTAKLHFADDVDTQRGLEFLERAIDRLAGAPGIESVAVAGRLPISRYGVIVASLDVADRTFEPGEEPRASLAAVSTAYFHTLDIERRQGRLFDRTEMEQGAEVALIDEGLATNLWPNSDPIGRRIRQQREGSPWLTIVGTVSSVDPGEMLAGIDANPPNQVYVPMSLSMTGEATGWGPVTQSPTLVMKSALAPHAVADLARRELAALDSSVPVYHVMTMGRVLDQHYFAQHIWGVMFSVIAVVALLIAAVGAYGVTAYSVARRRRELAIRLALGAAPTEVRQSVVRQGLGLAFWGLALGSLGAVPLALSLNRLLHGVSPFDPAMLLGVVALLLTLAAAASAVPAWRAAGVDPAVALRDE
ncbi:MAG: ABC transporter permease [Thermoanaerobaculia bacterium]|nr:ABC transporter permease [Thermoanaerobaculia bacterium]